MSEQRVIIVSHQIYVEMNLFFFRIEFRYRQFGTSADWSRVAVSPVGSTTMSIHNLKPSTVYEFQIVGKNALGDGMLSKIVTAKTAGIERISFLNAYYLILVGVSKLTFRVKKACIY